MVDPVTSLSLEWGEDFQVSAVGGLVLASGADQIRQRVIRALLTIPQTKLADGTHVPADYIFDRDYGIGLPVRIGEPEIDSFSTRLKQQVRHAVMSAEGVDATKAPDITIFEYPNGLVQIIIVVFLATGGDTQIILDVES